MALSLLAVLAGLGLLVWGAERFVHGAAALARNLGVPVLIIGLLVVGIGTSAPEILIAATASWAASPALAVGNAIGSNIANVGLVIGVAALAAPLATRSTASRREMPMMVVVVILAWVLLSDGVLDAVDAVVLLAGFVALVSLMVAIAVSAQRNDPLSGDFDTEIPTGVSTRGAAGWALVGLLVLLVGSRLVVWGASGAALALGVPELVVGLTVVALGTSLPELATSVVAALKGEADIAIGNVIGSNMFNLLPVLALPGLLAPGPLDAEVVTRDFPVMIGFSLALFALLGLRGASRLHRLEAVPLVGAFIAYQAWLVAGAI